MLSVKIEGPCEAAQARQKDWGGQDARAGSQVPFPTWASQRLGGGVRWELGEQPGSLEGGGMRKEAGGKGQRMEET